MDCCRTMNESKQRNLGASSRPKQPDSYSSSRFLQVTKSEGSFRASPIDISKASTQACDVGEWVDSVWHGFGVATLKRARRILTRDRLRPAALPFEVLEGHFLTDLYRPNAFEALFAEEILNRLPPSISVVLRLPATAGNLDRIVASIEGKRRSGSRWKAWLAPLAASAIITAALLRLALRGDLRNESARRGDWIAAVFSGKGTHTAHIWKWLESHAAASVVVLGHKPLHPELRKMAGKLGIPVVHALCLRDLPAALGQLWSSWGTYLDIHRDVENDLAIRTDLKFHVKTATWFLRGFLHESWIRRNDWQGTQGAIFGLVAHADSRMADQAWRLKGVRTMHWIHGIVDDALHFRANSSFACCATPSDAEIHSMHSDYGLCFSGEVAIPSASETTAGKDGLLVVTNLIHPDQRFLGRGGLEALEELLRIAAEWAVKHRARVTWRPHPRESSAVDFLRCRQLALALGIFMENKKPFGEQIRKSRYVVSTLSTSIAEISAAGTVPAIYANLPFEEPGHASKLPDELKFRSFDQLERTLSLIDKPLSKADYLKCLLKQFPDRVSQPQYAFS